MKFTLRQIQVFLAIAHHENVSKAAQELAMSQSAASGALKELETYFDIQLFDRVGKRLRLNASGGALRPKAEALMAMSYDLESALANTALASNLHIGATLTIGNFLCIDLINRYKHLAADTKLKLSIANTETIKQELLNFDIDIGMLEGNIHHPDLDIRVWRNDTLQFFCSPTHPLAKKKRVSLEDLCQASWILRETGSGTRQAFDRAMHDQLSTLHIALELEQTEAIKRAVAQNLGISCLSNIALVNDIQRGDLIALECQGLNLERTLYIATHREKYQSKSLQQWLALCQD